MLGLIQVLTYVIRENQQHPRMCALAFEALSEAVLVPSTIASLEEEQTVPVLLDAFSWHQEEDFQVSELVEEGVTELVEDGCGEEKKVMEWKYLLTLPWSTWHAVLPVAV